VTSRSLALTPERTKTRTRRRTRAGKNKQAEETGTTADTTVITNQEDAKEEEGGHVAHEKAGESELPQEVHHAEGEHKTNDQEEEEKAKLEAEAELEAATAE
jgi:hypothetical protein